MVGILEFIVIGFFLGRIVANHRRDDLALSQRRTVMDGYNTDRVVGIFDHYRPETLPLCNHISHAADGVSFFTAEGEAIDPFLGDDDELDQVDGVRTFTQDAPLRSALSAVLEEITHILEILGNGIGGQHLSRVQWTSVTGKDVADLALGNGHQRHHVDDVLEGHQVMQTAAQHIRLVTCFAVQGNKSAFH